MFKNKSLIIKNSVSNRPKRSCKSFVVKQKFKNTFYINILFFKFKRSYCRLSISHTP